MTPSLLADGRRATAEATAAPAPARAVGPGSGAGRWLDAACLSLPALGAGALCAAALTQRSLSLDEAATATISAQHGSALMSAIAHDGGNMSGYYLLMHLWMGLAGHGALALRLPSVLAAAITVALVVLLGRRVFDRRVALTAGVLSAVSLPLVFWGQSARGYAPMVMFITASYVALVETLRGRPGSRTERRALLAYAILIALAVYMGLVAALVIPAQAALWAWRRRRLSHLAVVLAGVALVASPLAVTAARRGSGQLSWIPAPSLKALSQTVDQLASAGLEPNFHGSAATTVLLVMTLVILLGPGAAVRARGKGDRRVKTASHLVRLARPMEPDAANPESETWRPALLTLWLAIPLAIVLVVSLFGQPLLVARNLMVSLPAAALLIAWGLWRAQLPRMLAWSALAILIALRVVVLTGAYGVSPENWRAATGFVLARSAQSSCIAFYPADARMAFVFYLPSGAHPPRAVLPAVGWLDRRPFVEDYATLAAGSLAQLPRRCPQLWLVAGHRGQAKGSTSSRVDFGRYVALRGALSRDYAAARRVQFGYAPAVEVQLFTAAASASNPHGRGVGFKPSRP